MNRFISFETAGKENSILSILWLIVLILFSFMIVTG